MSEPPFDLKLVYYTHQKPLSCCLPPPPGRKCLHPPSILRESSGQYYFDYAYHAVDEYNQRQYAPKIILRNLINISNFRWKTSGLF